MGQANINPEARNLMLDMWEGLRMLLGIKLTIYDVDLTLGGIAFYCITLVIFIYFLTPHEISKGE
jgi:hypothetical protein